MRRIFNHTACRLGRNVVQFLQILLFASIGRSTQVPQSIPPSLTDANGACQRACLALGDRFHDSVFTGQSGNFDFLDEKQAEIIPACRVEPSSAADVSAVLGIVTANECSFAVRSGGHERSAGASNVEGGVVIDMVRFNDIRLADDGQSVTIGSGLRWGEVYRTLEKEQLMVLGGRVADVGVGGLLLGGGLSFFSNERGMACDSILSYEMVLPNSSVVTVSQDSHPELYRAMRGAGQMNFGIVCSFTLETFPSPPNIWFGEKWAVGKEVNGMLQANYKAVTTGMEHDPHAAMMYSLACISKDGTSFASVTAQHTAHNTTEHWPASFKQHEDLKVRLEDPHNFLASISNVTEQLAFSDHAKKQRTIYGTLTFKPSIELELRMSQILCEEVESDRNIADFLHILTFHPLSSGMIAGMQKRGGNAFKSLVGTKGPLVILNSLWQWSDRADDSKAYSSYYRLMSRIEEAARAMGLWHPFKYINYAEATQDVLAGYGDLGDLLALQRELDSTGVFASGGFAGGIHKLHDNARLQDKDVVPGWPETKSEL